MHESEVLTRARNEAKKHESVRMGTRKGKRNKDYLI
jgi:hypothetical protein